MCPDRKFSILLQFEVEKLSWLWLVVRTGKPTRQWAVVGVFLVHFLSSQRGLKPPRSIDQNKVIQTAQQEPKYTIILQTLSVRTFSDLGKHLILLNIDMYVWSVWKTDELLNSRTDTLYISVNSNNKNHKTELCQHFQDCSRNSLRQRIISPITVCFLVAHEFCIVYFFKIITFYNYKSKIVSIFFL